MKISFLLSLLVIFFVACNARKDYNSRNSQQENVKQDSLTIKRDEGYTGGGITFQLHINNVRYDSLLLRCEMIDRVFKNIGKTTDGNNWKFLIPDSVCRFGIHFFLIPKLSGDKPEDIRRLVFVSRQNEKVLNYGDQFPFDCNVVEMHIGYLNTQVAENVPMIHDDNREETFLATLHTDCFEMPFEQNEDFEIRGLYPRFPYISNYSDGTQENRIIQCLKIIETYSESHYLMGCIAEHRTDFTKDDLQKMYNAFSIKNQQSDFGEIIDKYLNHFFVFSNMELSRSDNNHLEFMVQDSTKMNLIIFSASWCAPCHEMIPELKDIYNDLKDRLDMTYISMDDAKTTNNWRNLMKEKAIPWRSLMAKDNIKAVQTKYNPVGSIPFALLVYPNKTVEIIDVRQKDQKEKLYSVCKGI